MATSGSYNTNKYTTSSSGTIGLNLSWTLKSQSIANNTSTLSWTLKSNGTMSSGYYVQAGPVTCTINGTKVVNTTSRFSMYGGGKYKKTGTITITHNADGTKSTSFQVDAAIYSASVNCTLSKTGIALPTINRYAQITSISGFTNNPTRDGYPTLVYTNPAGTSLTTGLKCRLCWDVNGTTNYSSWVTLNDEGGEYTFTSSTLTAANITSMLNACPDSNTLAVTCELASTFNSVDGSVTKVTTMNVVDSDPLIGTLSYFDIDSTTIGRTGSSSIIVQNQSTLRIKAENITAQNGTLIIEVDVEINDSLYTMTSASGYYYKDFVHPSLSGTFVVTIYAFDRRGNLTTKTFNVIVQPWEPPTALYTLERVNGFETNTTLYVSGSISPVSNTNTLTIQEQHKKTDESSWSSLATVPNQTTVTLSLNNNYSWDVRILVNDKYTTTEYTSSVGKGIPIMFIDKDRNSIGVNGYPDANNQIYVDGTIKSTGKLTAEGTVFPRYAHLITAEAGTSGITINTTSWKNIGSSNTIDIEAGKYIFELQIGVGYSTSTGRFRAGIKLDDVAYEGVNNVSQPSSAGSVNFYGEIEITTSGNHTFQIVGRVDNTGKTVTAASYTVNTILLLPTK